jgi:hypothetical protein
MTSKRYCVACDTKTTHLKAEFDDNTPAWECWCCNALTKRRVVAKKRTALDDLYDQLLEN